MGRSDVTIHGQALLLTYFSELFIYFIGFAEEYNVCNERSFIAKRNFIFASLRYIGEKRSETIEC